MSITDELREAINELRVGCEEKEGCGALWYPEPPRDRFSEIADRINGKVASDYVQLPKDAEGIPFHVGDHVEVPDGLPSEGKPWQAGTITRLDLGATCWHVRVIAGGISHVYLTENVRHAYVPTVEDVLRNVVTLCHNTWKEESPFHFYDVDDVMKSGNIAEYAAKLRLAGDAE